MDLGELVTIVRSAGKEPGKVTEIWQVRDVRPYGIWSIRHAKAHEGLLASRSSNQMDDAKQAS